MFEAPGNFKHYNEVYSEIYASKFQIINVNFILINNKEISGVQPCLLSSENILQLPNEY